MPLNIDKAYFFGDSLSDIGNVSNFTGGFFPNSGPSDLPPFNPPFPYAPGRFSNGNVWADYFTEEFNLTINPFIAGFDPGPPPEIIFDLSDTNNGTNFAIGGADSANGNVGIVPLGLEQQIEQFEFLIVENQSPEEVVEDDLFFVWAGANDYLSFIEDADNPDTLDVIEVEADFPKKSKDAVVDVVDINIKGAIQDIIDVGGENIVVFNLPDLDILPLAQGLDIDNREKLRDLTKDHNDRLLDITGQLEESNPNVNLIHIDANKLFDDFILNPNEFGFTNVIDNYSGIDLYTQKSITPAVGNIDEYLFIDSVHPSTTAHQFIADLVIYELTSEGLIM